MVFLVSHGFPMVSHGFPVVFPWFSYGFPGGTPVARGPRQLAPALGLVAAGGAAGFGLGKAGGKRRENTHGGKTSMMNRH